MLLTVEYTYFKRHIAFRKADEPLVCSDKTSTIRVFGLPPLSGILGNRKPDDGESPKTL
jgi:hypothetical protein